MTERTFRIIDREFRISVIAPARTQCSSLHCSLPQPFPPSPSKRLARRTFVESGMRLRAHAEHGRFNPGVDNRL
jgi:hypothetical protein